MAEVAQPQGASSLQFDVLDHRGRPADSDYVCATNGASRGELVYRTAAGVCARATTGLGADAELLGFLDNFVVNDMDTRAIYVHGDYAQVNQDKVAIWRLGRVRLTAVDGSVSAGDYVYPAADGKVSATNAGTDRIVGRCVKGNSVAGGAIEIEFDLYAA